MNIGSKTTFLHAIFSTYEQYITPSVLLAEQLNCSYKDTVCFRAASVDTLVAAQTKVNNMLTSLDLVLFFEPWVPVIDNVIVYGQLYETIQNVSFSLKPLIIGTLTEETLSFIYSAYNNTMTPKLYSEVLVGFFGSKAVKVLERFPPLGTGDQRSRLSQIGTQWVFACTNRIFARRAPSYLYVFGYPLDFDGWGLWSYCNGHVCHGSELPFFFQSTWVNFTDAGRRVSQSMGTYWTNFAKSQNPNQPVSTTVQWPKPTMGDEKYMYFQDPLQVESDYIKNDCDFWDTIGYKKESFF